MKTIAILLVLVVAAQTAVTLDRAIDKKWASFKSLYAKKYSDEMEESRRMKIFMDNLREIEEHNERYKNKKVTFKVGINELSDMSFEEILQTKTGYQSDLPQDGCPVLRSLVPYEPRLGVVPPSLDWRKFNAITPVKNQDRCTTCWAFSAAGAMESHYNLKFRPKIPVSMSEQNLMDCTYPGVKSCKNGGQMACAFQYVINNGGIDSEEQYPFINNNQTCRYKAAGALRPPPKYFVQMPSGDERQLLNAVAIAGPVSVGIGVTPAFHAFPFGSRQIFDDENCSPTINLTHAVLIVGYGTENGQDYWLAKNSWGPRWGMYGYIKIARNKNRCGIARFAVYPVY